MGNQFSDPRRYVKNLIPEHFYASLSPELQEKLDSIRFSLEGTHVLYQDIPHDQLIRAYPESLNTYQVAKRTPAMKLIQYTTQYTGRTPSTIQRNLEDSFDENSKRTKNNFDIIVIIQ